MRLGPQPLADVLRGRRRDHCAPVVMNVPYATMVR